MAPDVGNAVNHADAKGPCCDLTRARALSSRAGHTESWTNLSSSFLEALSLSLLPPELGPKHGLPELGNCFSVATDCCIDPKGGKIAKGKLLERFTDFCRRQWIQMLITNLGCGDQAMNLQSRRRRTQQDSVERRAAEALVCMGETVCGAARPRKRASGTGQ